jgi:hypothetical protein
VKLSEARRIVASMFPDPWQRLRQDWPAVRVVRTDERILGERYELVRWEVEGPVIYLHHDLSPVQERAGLTHAMEHLDRGAPCESLRSIIEQRVVEATARWLIPDERVLAASLHAHGGDLYRSAHDLNVPYFVLKQRIRHLTEDEWIYIEKHREGVA